VERAVEEKLKEAMRTGVPKPLSTRDLLAAAQAMKPSTREWFADARNYALYANDGGQYDELVKYNETAVTRLVQMLVCRKP